ncbi:hypothetical protein ABW19_dt0206876 [Dactylella cylindrospora]|nr:hypothetical protein ABW19_dt0206876 [Dactylella cylindrospora]
MPAYSALIGSLGIMSLVFTDPSFSYRLIPIRVKSSRWYTLQSLRAASQDLSPLAKNQCIISGGQSAAGNNIGAVVIWNNPAEYMADTIAFYTDRRCGVNMQSGNPQLKMQPSFVVTLDPGKDNRNLPGIWVVDLKKLGKSFKAYSYKAVDWTRESRSTNGFLWRTRDLPRQAVYYWDSAVNEEGPPEGENAGEPKDPKSPRKRLNGAIYKIQDPHDLLPKLGNTREAYMWLRDLAERSMTHDADKIPDNIYPYLQRWLAGDFKPKKYVRKGEKPSAQPVISGGLYVPDQNAPGRNKGTNPRSKPKPRQNSGSRENQEPPQELITDIKNDSDEGEALYEGSEDSGGQFVEEVESEGVYKVSGEAEGAQEEEQIEEIFDPDESEQSSQSKYLEDEYAPSESATPVDDDDSYFSEVEEEDQEEEILPNDDDIDDEYDAMEEEINFSSPSESVDSWLSKEEQSEGIGGDDNIKEGIGGEVTNDEDDKAYIEIEDYDPSEYPDVQTLAERLHTEGDPLDSLTARLNSFQRSLGIQASDYSDSPVNIDFVKEQLRDAMDSRSQQEPMSKLRGNALINAAINTADERLADEDIEFYLGMNGGKKRKPNENLIIE